MEYRPLCGLCGHKHFQREPHVWGKGESTVEDKGAVVEPGVAKPARRSDGGVRKAAAVPAVADVSREPGRRGRPRLYADAKERRKEYMRAYMRDRRAKK